MILSGRLRNPFEYIEKIDHVLALPEEQHAAELEKIRKEVQQLNEYSICGKNELKWEVKKNYANFFSLTMVGLEQLYLEYANKVKLGLRPKFRHQFKLDTEHNEAEM